MAGVGGGQAIPGDQLGGGGVAHIVLYIGRWKRRPAQCTRDLIAYNAIGERRTVGGGYAKRTIRSRTYSSPTFGHNTMTLAATLGYKKRTSKDIYKVSKHVKKQRRPTTREI